jgi:prepilin-type N-terminal cleavage/methylation domain-containing protein
MVQIEFGRRGDGNRGFALIEVLVATVILGVALVTVAQLVPVSMRLNAANRRDSTALVMAQRELDQMIGQPLSAASFTNAEGVSCNLGNPASPNTVVGNPVVVVKNRPTINFGATAVAGYNFNYTDPNDASGTSYEVRWAVITIASGGNAYAKRFIVGARRRGGNGPFLPVTLDTLVQK